MLVDGPSRKFYFVSRYVVCSAFSCAARCIVLLRISWPFLAGHGGLLKYMMTIHPHIRLRDERNDAVNPNGDTTVKPVDSRFDNCELRRYKLCWEENNEAVGQLAANENPGSRLPITLTQID